MKTKMPSTTSIEVNLHDMSVSEGKKLLERTIISAPKSVKEVVVIHGYHNGTDMQNMVRKQFKCRRVERKILTLNDGITIFVLKEEW